MNDVAQELAHQVRAAEALRDALGKMPGIDEETVRDSIEGETNLHETISGAVELLTEAETMRDGLKTKKEQFEGRLSRYEARIGFLRSAIEQAMLIGGLDNKELPDCTLVLAKRAAKTVVTDEEKIPASYWKPQDPVLDLTALGKDLKAKKPIPGATLSNGGVSLTVRRT